MKIGGMNMTFPILETNRLQLVEVTPDHAEALYEILSDETVTRFYGMDPLTSAEQGTMIVKSFDDTYKTRRGIRWGMVVKETGTFIGTIGFNHLSEYSKKTEIGFELSPSHWGKGYTSEAVQVILRYAFETLALYRVGAVTFPDNIASIRLLKKHGFIQEGELRGYLYQGGQSHDGYLFSMIRPDWQGQK